MDSWRIPGTNIYWIKLAAKRIFYGRRRSANCRSQRNIYSFEYANCYQDCYENALAICHTNPEPHSFPHGDSKALKYTQTHLYALYAAHPNAVSHTMAFTYPYSSYSDNYSLAYQHPHPHLHPALNDYVLINLII